MRLTRSAVLVCCKALLAMALFLAPMSGFADTLSWTLPSNVGTYSYAGGSAPFTGSGIGVQSVQDTTTGVIFNIFNGLLSFTTGPSNGVWSWGTAQPGQLSLTGCIDNVTVSGACNSSSPTSVLFSDAFTSAQIFSVGPNFKVTLGNIIGNIDAGLAAKFGVSTTISDGVYNTTTQIGGSYGSSFSNAPNLGGSINSDPASSSATAPEPGTMSLLGAGLILLVGFRKKILTASA
jgi:PEP-CTERM motif-containing protein